MTAIKKSRSRPTSTKRPGDTPGHNVPRVLHRRILGRMTRPYVVVSRIRCSIEILTKHPEWVGRCVVITSESDHTPFQMSLDDGTELGVLIAYGKGEPITPIQLFEIRRMIREAELERFMYMGRLRDSITEMSLQPNYQGRFKNKVKTKTSHIMKADEGEGDV